MVRMFRSRHKHVLLTMTIYFKSQQSLRYFFKPLHRRQILIKKVLVPKIASSKSGQSYSSTKNKSLLFPYALHSEVKIGYTIVGQKGPYKLHNRKVTYLCNLFEINEEKAEELLKLLDAQNPNIKTETLNMKIDLLLRYNVPLGAIKNQFEILNVDFLKLQHGLNKLWFFDVDLSQDSENHLQDLMTCCESGMNIHEMKKNYLELRLGVSPGEIAEMFERFPEILCVGLKKYKTNLDIVLRDGFITPRIILRTSILFMLTPELLEYNLNFLKQLTVDEVKGKDDSSELSEADALKLEIVTGQTFTTMLQLSKRRINILRRRLEVKISVLGDKTKQEYLAERLDCTVDYVKDVIVKKYPEVLSINTQKLQENLDTLLNSGYINQSDVLKYPLILCFKTKTIEKRIKQLQDIGFNVEKRFVNTFRKASDTHFKQVTSQFLMDQNILQELNCKDRNEYIKKRLECSEEDLKFIADIYSYHLTMRLTRLKECLDFLLVECQLNPREIIEYPRIFNSSLENMKKRKTEVEELGIPLSAYILGVYTRKYQKKLKRQICNTV